MHIDVRSVWQWRLWSRKPCSNHDITERTIFLNKQTMKKQHSYKWGWRDNWVEIISASQRSWISQQNTKDLLKWKWVWLLSQLNVNRFINQSFISPVFFKLRPWWPLRHFEKQLFIWIAREATFHLNTGHKARF